MQPRGVNGQGPRRHPVEPSQARRLLVTAARKRRQARQGLRHARLAQHAVRPGHRRAGLVHVLLRLGLRPLGVLELALREHLPLEQVLAQLGQLGAPGQIPLVDRQDALQGGPVVQGGRDHIRRGFLQLVGGLGPGLWGSEGGVQQHRHADQADI